MLKVEVCAFSGLKIYPGHGKRVTRADGRTMIFLNSKCERNNGLKRNPRKVGSPPCHDGKREASLEY
jgi:large subunit ribosomal protein L24e